VQPRGRAQRDRRRQFHAADAGELLDLLLLQPAVAADGHLAVRLLKDRELQRADQVFYVAELPAGAGVGHDQQPGRLEVAGQRRIHTGADEHRGAHHRDVEPRVGTGRPACEPFDLQEVADRGRLGGGPQLGVLGERYVVVRQGPVDHRRGAEDDAGDARCRRRGQDRLRTADVEGGTGGGVGLQVQVEGEMHHDVDGVSVVAQPVGDRGVTYVEGVPLGLAGLAAALVQRDDPLDLLRCREPLRQQRAHS
jgi:hypothetical protein